MKIVILDGYTANPGDLDWSPLEKFGELIVYDRCTPEQIVQRAAGAHVIINNKNLFTADVLRHLPDLKYIGLLSTGVNVVDLQAAKKQGITVTNIPAYSTDSVAQLVFALLLEMASQVGKHDSEVHSGKWVNCIDFCFTCGSLLELSGLTMGIVGLGDIGQAVAKIAQAFNMKTIAASRTKKNIAGVNMVDMDTLFKEADVVSLHCPFNDKTDRMINPHTLGLMKSSAYLINTGRGGLIDEDALADALNNGRLSGAGLDVLSTEPPAVDNPLLSAKNCVITPHIAWATGAARKRLLHILMHNLEMFINGTPQNVVS